MKVFQPVGSKLCKPKPNFLPIEIEKLILKVSLMFFLRHFNL